MPVVRFTESIQRHVPCPVQTCEGTTVRELLEAYFVEHPRARGYVLDDQGQLRRHMAIFVDGRQIRDRGGLADAVREGSTVDVVQALSGGCGLGLSKEKGKGKRNRAYMATRCHVATRKGLFTIERGSNGWTVTRAGFLGDNVTLLMHDPRTGMLLAALNHGHFGIKLHRSSDGGAQWTEVATPKYPEKPADYVPKNAPAEGTPADWSLKLVWALSPGGRDESGVIWCGTLPGGLFRSSDNGDSWELNRPLWDDPRREEWFGGGADHPGIHSVCVDPRDSRHVVLGVSCGGVWRTRDGGATWDMAGTGLRAEFMPPERQFDPNVQDPHLVAQCAADPDALWVQHHNGIFRSTASATTWSEISGVQLDVRLPSGRPPEAR